MGKNGSAGSPRIRSFGVTVIGVLGIFGGGLGIFLNLSKLFTDCIPSLIFISIGLIGIIVATGLLRLREWARKGEIIFLILDSLLVVLLALTIGFNLLYSIRWISSICFIYYLTRPKVKRQFTGAES